MDDLDRLINEIMIVLDNDLPNELANYKYEFEELINGQLMRASYDVLNKLSKDKRWKPSIRFFGLLERYKIVF